MSEQPVEEYLASEMSTLLAQIDRVPTALLASAGAVLGWRDLDARLAVLVAEQMDVASAGVRGVPPRMLTFSVDGVTVDIGLSDRPDLSDERGDGRGAAPRRGMDRPDRRAGPVLGDRASHRRDARLLRSGRCARSRMYGGVQRLTVHFVQWRWQELDSGHQAHRPPVW
jgi:hypothetical protein